MKRQSVLVLVSTVVFLINPCISTTALADLAGITIINDIYRIDGSVALSGITQNTYHHYTSTPVEDFDEISSLEKYAFSHSVAAEDYIYVQIISQNEYAKANAARQIAFKPNFSSLHVTFSVLDSLSGGGDFKVADMTTDTDLVYESTYHGGGEYYWSVNTDHIYELTLRAHVYNLTTSDWNRTAEQGIALTLKSLASGVVPAPSAILLSTIGIGYSSWRLRKRKEL